MYPVAQSTNVKESYYEEVIQQEICCSAKGMLWGAVLSIPLWGMLFMIVRWLL